LRNETKYWCSKLRVLSGSRRR